MAEVLSCRGDGRKGVNDNSKKSSSFSVFDKLVLMGEFEYTFLLKIGRFYIFAKSEWQILRHQRPGKRLKTIQGE